MVPRTFTKEGSRGSLEDFGDVIKNKTPLFFFKTQQKNRKLYNSKN